VHGRAGSRIRSAVLEGIEGTLEELIGRVHPKDVRALPGGLLVETAAVRRSFEERVGGSADDEFTGLEGRFEPRIQDFPHT